MRRTLHTGPAGAILIIVAGAAFAGYAATTYKFGSIRYIGPGLFPVSIGVFMCVIGIASLVLGEKGQPIKAASINWRALLCVCSGCALFALAIDFLGLFLSVFLSTFVTSFSQRGVNVLQSAMLSLILSVVAVLIFALGLGVQLAIWPRVG